MLLNTIGIVNCRIPLKCQDARDMDDLESSANPRWDDGWRHTYATGLAEMLDVNKRTDPTADPAAVTFPTTRDHNNWGDLTARYTRWQFYEIRT